MAKASKVIGYFATVAYMDGEREEFQAVADPVIHPQGSYVMLTEQGTDRTVIIPLFNVRTFDVKEVFE